MINFLLERSGGTHPASAHLTSIKLVVQEKTNIRNNRKEWKCPMIYMDKRQHIKVGTSYDVFGQTGGFRKE